MLKQLIDQEISDIFDVSDCQDELRLIEDIESNELAIYCRRPWEGGDEDNCGCSDKESCGCG